jgi:hypothetical protein
MNDDPLRARIAKLEAALNKARDALRARLARRRPRLKNHDH